MTSSVRVKLIDSSEKSSHDLINDQLHFNVKMHFGEEGVSNEISASSPIPHWRAGGVLAAIGEWGRQSPRRINGHVAMPANLNWILVRPDATTLTFTDEAEHIVLSHGVLDAPGQPGAREVTLEGLGSQFEPVTDTVPLKQGQTTTTAKKFRRINSGSVSRAGSSGRNSDAIVATNTGKDLRQQIPAGSNTMASTLFTVPSGKKAIIRNWGVRVRATLQNETQVVTLPDGTTDGTFLIYFGDDPSSPIDHDADGDAFKTALVAGTALTSSDVDVDGEAGGPYTVRLKGAYAGTNVPELVGDGTNLVGANPISFETTREKTAAVDGVHTIDTTGYTGTQIKHNLDGYFNDANSTFYAFYYFFTGGDSAASVQAAVQARFDDYITSFSLDGTWNVAVTKDGDVYTFTFSGTLVGLPIDGSAQYDWPANPGDRLPYTIQDPSPALGEQQTMTIAQGISTGNYAIEYDTEQSYAIPITATIAQIEDALESIAGIGAGNVAVNGLTSHTFLITFQGDLLEVDVDLLVGINLTLSGGEVTVTTSQDGGQPLVSTRLVTKGLTSPQKVLDHFENVTGVRNRQFFGGVVVDGKTDIWIEAKNGTLISGTDVQGSYELILVDI